MTNTERSSPAPPKADRRPPADGIAGWAPSPWFLVTPPEPQVAVVDRRRVTDTIDRAVAASRVTVVAAPAGFGKTVALGTWARESEIPVAWVTLTHFDDDEPVRLLSAVVSALQRQAETTGAPALQPLRALNPDPHDLAASHDALLRALSALAAPLALVVDDAHLAGRALSSGLVRSLLEHAPPTLRIVLVGRDGLRAPLGRLLLTGSATDIGAPTLAFTADEVAAAATALGVRLEPNGPAAIRESTDGWPVAVRLGLASAGRDDSLGDATPLPTAAASSSALADYVAEEIIDRLPPELADFVLATTTCSRVDAGLAAALSDRDDSAALLEQCLRTGLFLDRFSEDGGAPVFRWHAVFADQCRTILRRRDPARSARLDIVAAERLASSFPLAAVEHALHGGNDALAARILATHWLGLVMRSQERAVARLALELSEPWRNDPEILMIRACCLDLLDDRIGATLHFARATAGSDAKDAQSGRRAVTRALAETFLADDHATLGDAVDRLDAFVQGTADLDPELYSGVLFVLGRTELRLRRAPDRAVRLLSAAVKEATAVGQPLLGHRASANLGFALAFGGHFTDARRALAEIPGLADGPHAWQSYDGGIEAMSEGWVAFWQDDLPAAEAAFRHVIAGGGGTTSYAALACAYLALVACEERDTAALAEAEQLVREGVADREVQGVPWHVYRGAVLARIAEARGDTELALATARRVDDLPHIPVARLLLAGLFRRAGEHRTAVAMLRKFEPAGLTSFARTSLLLNTALLHSNAGNDENAHRALERSLDAAAGERVALPFAEADPRLRELLVEHAAGATAHTAFLADRIARLDRASHATSVRGLSPREQEILGLLRTPMTVAEIAVALHLSVNTVKTHLRSLYRKLGVSSRREAVRAPLPRGPGEERTAALTRNG